MPRYAWCLIALIAGLLVVGVESRTPIRHFLQVLPALAILVLALRRTVWAADAALPVFAVWLALMTAIWLTLLGAARLVPGHYPPIEVALTVVIGIAAAFGLVLAIRSSDARLPVRIVSALIFATLQLVAIWLSLKTRLAQM